MGDEEVKPQRRENFLGKIIEFWADLVVKPVVWFQENIVVPNQQEYYWYHERLPRVPTVDQCYTDDYVCVYEAQQQFARDREVDRRIVHILKRRFQYCCIENSDDKNKCSGLQDTWEKALTNFFIKYGELGFKNSVITCYMKQKHRMAFERRHGPIGSGRKIKEE